MDARAYLEELQRAMSSKVNHGRLSHENPFAESHLQGWLQANPWLDATEVHRWLDEIASRLNSRLDEPFTLAIIDSLTAKVEVAAKECGMRLPPLPLVGSLPTGDVNAFAARVPGGCDFVVVLHSGIIGFIFLLTKLVASCIPERQNTEGDGDLLFSLKQDRIFQRIESDATIRERFVDLIEAYLVRGNPLAAQPYVLREPHASLGMVLCESAELFVLCHEFGHVLAGHFGQAESNHRSVHGVDLDVYSESWDMEKQADLIGLDLCLRAMRHEGFPPSASYLGADLFFSAIEILLRCRGILELGDDSAFLGGTTSHPPVTSRRESLRQSLIVIVGSRLALVPLGAGEVLANTVERLYTLTKTQFMALHDSKAASSAIWKP